YRYITTCNSPTASGNVTVGNDFFIPTGGSYTQTGGTLTLNGDVIDSGTLTITSGGAININGSASVISGNGAINDSAGTITVTHNKTIHTGTVLTLGTASANTTLAIATGTTINNIGNVTLSGSMTGAAASSIWVNNAQSHLTVSGAVLATGVLEAS